MGCRDNGYSRRNHGQPSHGTACYCCLSKEIILRTSSATAEHRILDYRRTADVLKGIELYSAGHYITINCCS